MTRPPETDHAATWLVIVSGVAILAVWAMAGCMSPRRYIRTQAGEEIQKERRSPEHRQSIEAVVDEKLTQAQKVALGLLGALSAGGWATIERMRRKTGENGGAK